jgi:hypothetical protein
MALQAAWVCDDEEEVEAAKKCRLRTVDFVTAARGAGLAFCDEKPVEHLVLADAMRRAGLFEGALAECVLGLDLAPEDGLRKALLLESSLAKAGDEACHSIEAAW